jgi:putative transposase
VLTTHRGATLFIEERTASLFIEALRERAASARFDVLVYCVMPDHVHLVVEAVTETADLKRFVDDLKQRTGYAFARENGGRLWQTSWFDHVFRPEESTLEICRYVVANPVRAGLVMSARAYPYTGSTRFSMNELLEDLSIRSGRSR